MDGISRSRGWDKEIPHCVLPMEQLVLSDKWARKVYHVIKGQVWNGTIGKWSFPIIPSRNSMVKIIGSHNIV